VLWGSNQEDSDPIFCVTKEGRVAPRTNKKENGQWGLQRDRLAKRGMNNPSNEKKLEPWKVQPIRLWGRV